MLTGMLHMHVSSWIIGLILFFISFILLKQGKVKGQKITHMILRLFYVFIFLSGATIIILFSIEYSFPPEYAIKGLAGLWLITMMELILVNGKKGIYKSLHWILFVIALALVFFYGYIVL